MVKVVCPYTGAAASWRVLLARSGLADPLDAAVVCLAGDGDDILTSDPGDLRALAQAAGVHVELIPV